LPAPNAQDFHAEICRFSECRIDFSAGFLDVKQKDSIYLQQFRMPERPDIHIFLDVIVLIF